MTALRTGIIAAGVLAGTLLIGAAALGQESAPYVSPFSEAVVNNLRVIRSVGQAYGNRDNVFSKVGDSISVNLNFMHPFGWGTYDLGPYGYLEPAIDHFNYAITGPNRETAFTHESLAAGVGWASWGVLEPELADPEVCQPGEKPLECEYRIMSPQIALIMLGTNDASYLTPEEYTFYLERIMQISLDWGVIPVFSTIPMRPDIPETIYRFNDHVRELTARYNLPLWDYAAVMNTLPDYGLAWDNLHPSSPPGDRPQAAAVFSPENLQYGYVARNLTGLQTLYDVWQSSLPPN